MLFITHGIDLLWICFGKLRGTKKYEGDRKGLENMNITVEIGIRLIFILYFQLQTMLGESHSETNDSHFRPNVRGFDRERLPAKSFDFLSAE